MLVGLRAEYAWGARAFGAVYACAALGGTLTSAAAHGGAGAAAFVGGGGAPVRSGVSGVGGSDSDSAVVREETTRSILIDAPHCRLDRCSQSARRARSSAWSAEMSCDIT